MSFEIDGLSKYLAGLLEEVVSTAQGLDIDLPERRYTTTGGAVYDCPQVSVSSGQVTNGIVGNQIDAGSALSNCAQNWQSDVDIAIIREQAGKTQGRRGTVAPDLECVQKDTDTVSADVAILTAVAENLIADAPLTAQILLGEAQGGLLVAVLTIQQNVWV